MKDIEFKGMGLFNAEMEWEHPDRIEKTYEIIYVTEGDVFLYEGEEKYHLCKGDLILLRPHILHGGYKKSQGKTSFYWLHFSGEVPFSLSGYIKNYVGAGLFREIIHYDNMPKKDSNALRILTEHILLNIKFAHNLADENKLAQEVYEWIRINARAKMSNEAVSKHFGYNSEHLSRIVKKEYGMTLKRIIDKILCEKIEDLLLNSNYSIKEISNILGFEGDLSVLINFFKYHRKISPNKYRNKYTKIHMNLK